MLSTESLVKHYGVVYFYVKQYNLNDWQSVRNNNWFNSRKERLFLQEVVSYQATIEYFRRKKSN